MKKKMKPGQWRVDYKEYRKTDSPAIHYYSRYDNNVNANRILLQSLCGERRTRRTVAPDKIILDDMSLQKLYCDECMRRLKGVKR